MTADSIYVERVEYIEHTRHRAIQQNNDKTKKMHSQYYMTAAVDTACILLFWDGL